MLSRMVLFRHLSALALSVLCALPAAAQQPAADVPAEGPAAFASFLKGQQIGREEVTLARTADGWRISATSNLTAGAVRMENRVFEIRYAPDWQPIELR